MLRVLSLGAGVQSSVIALMSAAGELPPIDHAIFADTGWEPKAVYDWLHGYLCLPLDQVDLSTPADRGQLSFLDECSGVCGV